MELRALRYFLAVANEKNITRAASALYITQPILSRTLMELENELGKPLLLRSKRGIELTQEGPLLQKRAADILSLVEKTTQEIKTDQEIAGDIFLAAGKTEAIRRIAETMTHLIMSHPRLRLRVFSGERFYVLDQLDKGLVDLG
jgi:DNA-binding transcriptional LysR family regulator